MTWARLGSEPPLVACLTLLPKGLPDWSTALQLNYYNTLHDLGSNGMEDLLADMDVETLGSFAACYQKDLEECSPAFRATSLWSLGRTFYRIYDMTGSLKDLHEGIGALKQIPTEADTCSNNPMQHVEDLVYMVLELFRLH